VIWIVVNLVYLVNRLIITDFKKEIRQTVYFKIFKKLFNYREVTSFEVEFESSAKYKHYKRYM
jgi:hypothetical protein